MKELIETYKKDLDNIQDLIKNAEENKRSPNISWTIQESMLIKFIASLEKLEPEYNTIDLAVKEFIDWSALSKFKGYKSRSGIQKNAWPVKHRKFIKNLLLTMSRVVKEHS